MKNPSRELNVRIHRACRWGRRQSFWPVLGSLLGDGFVSGISTSCFGLSEPDLVQLDPFKSHFCRGMQRNDAMVTKHVDALSANHRAGFGNDIGRE